MKNQSIKIWFELLRADIEHRRADLRYADLSDADLRYADLRYADLSDADLSDADLSDADLSDANLKLVQSQTLILLSLTRHNLICNLRAKTIKIGCHKYSIDEWLTNYDQIGQREGYSTFDIEIYHTAIKHCAKESETI